MSVATIKTRLAAIQALVSGVRRAYAQVPASLPPGDAPAFINYTGPARFEDEWVIRTFLMRLFVKPLGGGIDGEAERECEPFFESVRDAFLARPGLELNAAGTHLAEVQNARLVGDNGLQELTAPGGEKYIGIEWRLEVTSYVEVNYAPGA